MSKTIDRDTLVHLCSHLNSLDGSYALKAIEKANELLKANGLTWYDVVKEQFPETSTINLDTKMLEKIHIYLEYHYWLEENEIEFLESIHKLVATGVSLNDAQLEQFRGIRRHAAAIDDDFEKR